MGGCWIKKGNSLSGIALFRKEGYEGPVHPLPTTGRGRREVLGGLFLGTIYMFLIGFTFCQKLTFPATYFNVNFRTTFSLIANQIAHVSKSPFHLN